MNMPRPSWKSEKVGEGLDVGQGKRRYSPSVRPGPGCPYHKKGLGTGEKSTNDTAKRFRPKKP